MFESHVLNEKGINEIDEFKEKFANAFIEALSLMTENREKSIFKTKIEDAVFWGTKAIASKEDNFTKVKIYGLKNKLNGDN